MWGRIRPLSFVKQDFSNRGIYIGPIVRRRLARLPKETYDGFMRLIARLSNETEIKRVKIDPHERISAKTIREIPIRLVADHFVKGAAYDVLDLRGLESYWMREKNYHIQHEFPFKSPASGRFQELEDADIRGAGRAGRIAEAGSQVAFPFSTPVDARISELVDAITREAEKFNALARDPSATIDQVFDLIDAGKTNLGFLNVSVYRPRRDGSGKWELTQRTTHWTEDRGKYDPAKGGHEPETTLRSIIEMDGDIADVDICDLRTFERAGIAYDTKSIENDFEYAKGSILRPNKESRRMLWIKIQSRERRVFDEYGVEGVILFHNQVKKADERYQHKGPPPLLPEDPHGADIIKNVLKEFYIGKIREAIDAIRRREMQEAGLELSNPFILIRETSLLLTPGYLFDARKNGNNYPKSPEEYAELIGKLVDDRGVFPGDSEPLTKYGTFSPRVRGTSHRTLRRKGEKFKIEIFSPFLHARGRENRLIFDADLVAQMASFDAYGTPGVSYDRENYYQRRLFNAEMVPFVRKDGWPVSFAAMQGYEASINGRELYYAFIHFVMTLGKFQGFGLTSYSVREGVSSLYYSNIWDNKKANLIYNANGELENRRFHMWVAAHSGRLPAFYAFVKGFAGVDPAWAPIAETLFRDVHQRITPADELRARPQPDFMGAVKINGGEFPLALDPGVYPPHARYPVNRGVVDMPQSELSLPAAIRERWLETIGGYGGLADGNGLYFAGVLNYGRIREAKRREQRRQGGSALKRLGERVRRRMVDR